MNAQIFVNCLMAVYTTILVKKITHNLYWWIRRKTGKQIDEIAGSDTYLREEPDRTLKIIEYINPYELSNEVRKDWLLYSERMGPTLTKIEISGISMIYCEDWYRFMERIDK